MSIIITNAEDEAKLAAELSRTLGPDVEVFQSSEEDDDFTVEQWLGILAYNARQSRTYVGRLERNTKAIGEHLRSIATEMEISNVLASTGLTDEEIEEAIARRWHIRSKVRNVRSTMKSSEIRATGSDKVVPIV